MASDNMRAVRQERRGDDSDAACSKGRDFFAFDLAPLARVPPAALIDRNEDSELDQFVLALALAFAFDTLSEWQPTPGPWKRHWPRSAATRRVPCAPSSKT